MTERQKRILVLKTALEVSTPHMFGFCEIEILERMLAELELVESKEVLAEKLIEDRCGFAYKFAVDSDDEQWAALLRIREKRNDD